MREMILELLRDNAAVIYFTKADGTERRLVGTLNSKNIPEEYIPKSNKTNDDLDHVSVFDLENKGWRSFKISRVITAGPAV